MALRFRLSTRAAWCALFGSILTLVLAAPALAHVARPSAPVKIDLVLGRKLFRSNCGGCHTLPSAGTHGKIGPNLAYETVQYRTAVWMIDNGNSTMPAFPGTLTKSQIADVAGYVAKYAGA